MKQKESFHVVIIPKLATPLWLRQFNKAADMVFMIPASSNLLYWPASSHEQLYVAILFPYLNFRPWQLRRSPKVVQTGRELLKMFSNPEVDGGDLLFKRLSEFRAIPSMSRDMVWKMLFFGCEPPFPRRLPGERRKKRERNPRGEDEDADNVESENSGSHGLSRRKKGRPSGYPL